MNWKLKFIKVYLKTFPNRFVRQYRIEFVGRRLSILHHRWLHFNSHPWENEDKK